MAKLYRTHALSSLQRRPMPPKKQSKTKSGSPSLRGRSKSVEKIRSKGRERTPSRSRSRTRTSSRTRPNKPKSRAPASEPKVATRRRSPSSSGESSSPSSRSSRSTRVKSKLMQGPDASGDKQSRAAQVMREVTPSRFSQRIIQKVEANPLSSAPRENITKEHTMPKDTSPTGCPCLIKLETFVCKNICSSPLLAALGLLGLPLFVFWLNLMVFAPAVAANSTNASREVSHTKWGPGYPLAGVLWPTDWHMYSDIHCHLFVCGYMFLHFLLARFVPIGYRVSTHIDTRNTGHRCNGLFAFAFCLILFTIFQWSGLDCLKGMRPSNLIPKYWFGLLSAMVNIAVLFAFVNYFATKRVPRALICPQGNTGNFFNDLWVGRSTRPRWFGLDWKMCLLRPGLVGIILVELTLLGAQWERFERVSPALVALVAMHCIYVLDFYLFEYANLSTFEVRYEGFGFYLILGYLTVPFVSSIAACYLYVRPDAGRLIDAEGALEPNACISLFLGVVLFIFGYWIYRASNSQKDLFSREPNHPSFSDMDKISGPYSYRMLAGGWWGFVRHPNYLGDLMMAYGAALPSGFSSFVPWFYPVLLTVVLIHRIWRTEHHSSEKHGLIMVMYKKMVPNRLIPKVF